MQPLYQYLMENDCLKDLQECDENILHIYSRKVLDMIKSGDAAWETMVPKEVAGLIKKEKFFQ